MFFAISLSAADFFAAKTKVVISGVAYGPTAGVVVKFRQFLASAAA